MFLGARTTLSIDTASGAVARFTPEPSSRFLMHVYAGADRARWRTRGRSLRALSLGQLAPGITGELAATGQALIVRLRVQPGANLESVRFRLDSGSFPVTSQLGVGAGGGLQWTAGEEQGTIFYPMATSEARDFPPPLVSVVLEDGGARFRVRSFLSGDGARLPYTVTIPLEQPRFGRRVAVHGSDLAGQTWLSYEDTVARFDSTGALASLTVIAAQSLSQVWLSTAGPRISGVTAPDSPVSPTAAQPTVRGPADALLVALDPDGLLIDATHVGGDGYDSARIAGTDATGSVYWQGVSGEAISVTPGARWQTPPAASGNDFYHFGKWTPGRNRFDFQSYAPLSFYWLAPSNAGGVAVSYAPLSAPANTLSVEWLDGEGRATPGGARTVPIADAEGVLSRAPGPLASDAAGNLWLTGAFSHANGSVGNVLMKLSRGADGRVLWAGASPGATYQLEVDPVNGHLHQFVRTRQNSLGSQRGSPYRGACVDGGGYYRRLNAEGGFLDGMHLPAIPSPLLTPRGTLDWYSFNDSVIEENITRRETPDAATGPPALACMVDYASRQPQFSLARGQLVTLIGQRLGPLDARAGNLASELAGTRVLLDGEPVGIANVQSGLVTFRVPPDYSRPVVQVTVERNGRASAPYLAAVSDFAASGIFTTDGQGWGPAAFFGNTEPGGMVSFFATGFDQAREAHLLIDERHIVKADYIGPTQHLLPGIQQINFRLPADVRRGGLVTVSVSPQLPALPGAWPEARATLPVR